LVDCPLHCLLNELYLALALALKFFFSFSHF
jgi:hypothetical protein